MISKRALKKFYEDDGAKADQASIFYVADTPESHRHKLRKHWTQKMLGLRPTDSFLEIGCADGVFVREAARLCKRAVGMDISQARVAKAKAVSKGFKNVGFFVGEAQHLPAQKYDVVLCAEVLEHLPDPAKCLNQIAKVCKRDAIITVPGAINPLTRLLMRVKKRPFEDPKFEREGHLSFTTPEQLTREMKKRGFVLVKRANVGCFYCFPLGYYGTAPWSRLNKLSHAAFKALSSVCLYLDRKLDDKNVLGFCAGVFALKFRKKNAK